MTCPICDCTETIVFLVRRDVPVHQNVLYRDPDAAIGAGRGDLELAVCTHCGFVFNRAFDPAKLCYGRDYDNTQMCSPSFSEYVDGLVQHLLTTKGIRNSTIVEVGCGKGYFLRKLVADTTKGNRGYGFDPSYIGAESDAAGRWTFEKRFYGPDCSDIRADLIVFRHVIEHVPKPVTLLQSIRQTLGDDGASLVVCETPCIEWILKNKVVWDFFYEHCSYFSTGSLTEAMRQVGLRVEHASHVFQDQYLWFEARTRTDATKPFSTAPMKIVALCQEFERHQSHLVAEWRTRLAEMAQTGGVALWGAGAKGVTLANLLDPERTLITCVVDLNPSKQSCFVPGTGHPIVDYRQLRSLGVKTAVQMNPNYAAENVRLLQDAELDVKLIEPRDRRVTQ
jgi:SAM-dependent methyltransferase